MCREELTPSGGQSLIPSLTEGISALVLVKAFIDESGTGGEPRVMLAAIVSRSYRWHGFNWHWRKLLEKEGIPFSHITAMEKRHPPFEAWGKARCGPFVKTAGKLMNQHCDFGMTAGLSREAYVAHYRERLPRAQKDSAYGVCARALMESIIEETTAALGRDAVVDFILENNQHFEDARRIFKELKDHVPAISANLGQIARGEKDEFAGLQVADAVACLGRRSEQTAKFSTPATPGTFMAPRAHGRMPLFHLDLNERSLIGHCRQAIDIKNEKRWAAKKRKEAGKAAIA